MAPAHFCREPGVCFGSLVEYPLFETKVTQTRMKTVSLPRRHLATSPFSLHLHSRHRVFTVFWTVSSVLPFSKHFACIFFFFKSFIEHR